MSLGITYYIAAEGCCGVQEMQIVLGYNGRYVFLKEKCNKVLFIKIRNGAAIVALVLHQVGVG